MSIALRNIVLALCGFTVLASLAAYAATGGEFFTRFPSDEIAQSSEADPLEALFADETGLNDSLGEVERVESRFTLGLLPSGPGRDGISVMTLAGPAVLAGVVVVFLSWRSIKKASAGIPDTPAYAD